MRQHVDEYPFKVIAFIKFKTLAREGIKYVILNPRTDLRNFHEVISTAFRRPGQRQDITSDTIRWIRYCKKVKGSKDFSMIENNEVVANWSKNRGYQIGSRMV